MLSRDLVALLIDVDNTLLDNDRFAADLSARLAQDFGAAGHDRYWALYAKLRVELGYADYLATLQAFRAGRDDDPHLLQCRPLRRNTRLRNACTRGRSQRSLTCIRTAGRAD